jgi:hypothetical protein
MPSAVVETKLGFDGRTEPTAAISARNRSPTLHNVCASDDDEVWMNKHANTKTFHGKKTIQPRRNLPKDRQSLRSEHRRARRH